MTTTKRPSQPLTDRSMVFQVAYLRYLDGRTGSKIRLEAFCAGWAAHDKARSGTKRPKWARVSVASQNPSGPMPEGAYVD